MEITVREAQEEDAGALADLLGAIIRAGLYTSLDTELSEEAQREFIRTFPKRGVFNVAVCTATQTRLGLQDVAPLEEGSKVFGHVGVISTFVSLTAHRQGVGRRLSAATFAQAKALGFTKLSATIRADNPQAVAFYLSQGFSLIGTARRHAYLRGKYIDQVLAEKLLD